MLTDQEVSKIFSWLPYRDSWTVDRNQVDDNIEVFYGEVINSLTKNQLFDTHYSDDGGLGNYLEFVCYPKEHTTYMGNAVLVCISLCAPIAAYGQTTLNKGENFISFGGLFKPDTMGEISDEGLTDIEQKIKSILHQNNISLLENEFANRQLPDKIFEALQYENHNNGKTYLHGIFQKTD